MKKIYRISTLALILLMASVVGVSATLAIGPYNKPINHLAPKGIHPIRARIMPSFKGTNESSTATTLKFKNNNRKQYTFSGEVVKINMNERSFVARRATPWFRQLFGQLFNPAAKREILIQTDGDTQFLQQIKGEPWKTTDFLALQLEDRILVKSVKSEDHYLAKEVRIFLNKPRLHAHPSLTIHHLRIASSTLNLGSSSPSVLPKGNINLRDAQKAIVVLERQVQRLNDLILKLQDQIKVLQDKINQ